MRRLFLIVVATGVSSAVIVALASASRTASGAKAAPNPETSFVPAGTPVCGNDWPMFACGGNTAFSTLTQINKSNVANLKMVWQDSLEGPTNAADAENSPIVISGAGKNLPLESGTMFLETITGLKALDPTTGNVLWTYQGPAHDTVTNPSGVYRAARTESYGNGMIFGGQQDGTIVAVNAKTGAPIWTAQNAVYGRFGPTSRQESTAVTVFYNDGKDGIVLDATNGGDSAQRGFIDALNAKSGKLIWRWYTTPDVTQYPYILSWGNPAQAVSGGASIWSIPAVDPQLGQVYFGTGNAYPETGRAPGKSLWSDSMVSLDVKTGALKWFFQAVHHDEWDYDWPTPAVLFNTTYQGKPVKAIATMNKDGYVFVFNRVNGAKLPNFPWKEVPIPDLTGGKGIPLNNQWPTQPESFGGAAQTLIHCPTEEQAKAAMPGWPIAPDGKLMVATCPFAAMYADRYMLWGANHHGGADYMRMAYDPQTNDLITCTNVTMEAYADKSPTDSSIIVVDGGSISQGGQTGQITALNMTTNKVDWHVDYFPQKDGACYSGGFTTAGGLLFMASKGNSTGPNGAAPNLQDPKYGGYIYAYDAKTGKELWSWQAPGYIIAPSITYMVKGKQYVTEYVQGPTSSGKHDLLTTFAL
jgi:quinohemoprotein ethanol dehydrogenase